MTDNAWLDRAGDILGALSRKLDDLATDPLVEFKARTVIMESVQQAAIELRQIDSPKIN